MSGNRTAGSPLVTAAEWFAGGQRIPYDPDLLAAAIRDIAERHGVGAPAAASR